MSEAGHELGWNRGSHSAQPLLVRAYCSIWQQFNWQVLKVKSERLASPGKIVIQFPQLHVNLA